MRAVWVDEGNDADYGKLQGHGITEPFYSGKDPRVNLLYLNDVRTRGFNPGVYLCSQGEGWPGAHETAPAAWATWAYNKIREVAPGTSGKFPLVHLNCETHDPDWLLAMFKRWRARSPRRWTGWSMEGHQGGWMTPAFVTAMKALNIDAYLPQAFKGNMAPIESDRTALDLIKAGFTWDKVWCMYDAAQIRGIWDGCLFTQGRLP